MCNPAHESQTEQQTVLMEAIRHRFTNKLAPTTQTSSHYGIAFADKNNKFSILICVCACACKCEELGMDCLLNIH